MKYGQWLGFVGSMGMMLVLPQGAMAAQPSATEAVGRFSHAGGKG